MLRCINQLEQQTSGERWIDGEKVSHDQKQLDKIRSEVGMVFQHFNLYPHLTVLENITLAQRIVKKIPQKQAEEIAREQLKRVGIAEKANAYPQQLSGGQQQRVAICRALAMKPDVIYFDEATSALDPKLTTDMHRIIRELASEGMAVGIVTHEMGFAQEASDRICLLLDGEIAEDGPTEQVVNSPLNPRTREFLSSAED